jgi:hypothetical protein
MADEADDELPQQWQELEVPFPRAIAENLCPCMSVRQRTTSFSLMVRASVSVLTL